MILLLASLAEFLQFLKIVMWISIPLFVVSTLIVVFIHYRRKKSEALPMPPASGFALAFTGDEGMRELPFFQQQVFNSREQYQLLEEELKKIKSAFLVRKEEASGNQSLGEEDLQKMLRHFELKMQQVQQSVEYLEKSAIGQAATPEQDKELKRLQSVIEQLHREIALLRQQNESKEQEVQKLDRMVREMQEAARQAGTEARDLHLSQQERMEEIGREHFEEHNRLIEQVKLMHEECRRLESENSDLQQAVQEMKSSGLLSANTNADEHVAGMGGNSVEINPDWKNQLAETASLKEMIGDKNAQLQLLQQQLEQKTRLNHQLDAQMEELRRENGFLVEDNQWKLEETQKQQQLIEEGSAENRLLKQQLLDAEDGLSIARNEQKQLRQRMGEYEEEMSRSLKLIAQLEHRLLETGNQLKEYEALLREIQQRAAPLLAANTNHSLAEISDNGVLAEI